ncbi:hypothetical protein [Paracoccus sp. TOH]|uniref:hypothetical protein n=1 Tax=Paracoccus sp. TOH TaxID=1263728 RepID=UPI0025AFED15|nr:hypothetical protein [Paracoccus sp. TOH]WJS84064.1 hypothetical protein NBE95_09865 [Paracoccus sp. TOH]
MLIALVAVALRLPWVLFAIPAGIVTDRAVRRRLILGMDALRAAAFGGAAVAPWSALPLTAPPQVGVSSTPAFVALILATLTVGAADRTLLGGRNWHRAGHRDRMATAWNRSRPPAVPERLVPRQVGTLPRLCDIKLDVSDPAPAGPKILSRDANSAPCPRRMALEETSPDQVAAFRFTRSSSFAAASLRSL